MKLSEAIRLGAMTGPQGFGDFRDPSTGATCVLGAAADAIGVELNHVWTPLAETWPWLRTEGCCPACTATSDGDWHTGIQCGATLYHLNDDHMWTRERIADWVATIEPSETPTHETTPMHEQVQA